MLMSPHGNAAKEGGFDMHIDNTSVFNLPGLKTVLLPVSKAR